jgi:hypothetical protein
MYEPDGLVLVARTLNKAKFTMLLKTRLTLQSLHINMVYFAKGIHVFLHVILDR